MFIFPRDKININISALLRVITVLLRAPWRHDTAAIKASNMTACSGAQRRDQGVACRVRQLLPRRKAASPKIIYDWRAQKWLWCSLLTVMTVDYRNKLLLVWLLPCLGIGYSTPKNLGGEGALLCLWRPRSLVRPIHQWRCNCPKASGQVIPVPLCRHRTIGSTIIGVDRRLRRWSSGERVKTGAL